MTSIKICGTCEFKGEEILVEDPEDDFEEKPSGFFLCTRIKHMMRGEEDLNEPAYLIDGSDYFAALRVKSDFGCNAWELGNIEKLHLVDEQKRELAKFLNYRCEKCGDVLMEPVGHLKLECPVCGAKARMGWASEGD